MNKDLCQNLCQNSDFWQQRFLQDYGFSKSKKVPVNWKEKYYRRKNTRLHSFGKELESHMYTPYTDISIPFSDLDNIRTISSGRNHTLILTYDGKVYAHGENGKGQLGLGDRTTRLHPTLIPLTEHIKIRKISAGTEFSLILVGGEGEKEGQVYAFGNNNSGQLGIGNTENQNIPTLIKGIPKIKSISAGQYNSSLILDEKGHVWSFGDNINGQLGLGDTQNRSVPTRLQNLPKIKKISMGPIHGLILDESGKVYGSGSNNWASYSENIHILIPFDEKIKKISAGDACSLFLTKSEKVYACGSNQYGHIGLGNKNYAYNPTRVPFPENVRIQKISTGSNYSLFLSKDKRVYACGFNGTNELNLPGEQISVPTLIPQIHSVKSISGGLHNRNIILGMISN